MVRRTHTPAPRVLMLEWCIRFGMKLLQTTSEVTASVATRLLVLAVMLSAAGCFRPIDSGNDNREPGGPIAGFEDPDKTAPAGTLYAVCFSEAAGGNYSYLIYLPPSYDLEPTRVFPVIYWLHGGPGTQRTGAPFVATYADAIERGVVPEAIIVLLNGVNGSLWMDSIDGSKPVETAIIEDLIPCIDATYRTIPTREGRLIEGFSMGGWGALHLGFRYNDVFGAISSMAPALIEPNSGDAGVESVYNGPVLQGDFEYWQENDPFTLAEENADEIRGTTPMRLVIGDNDSEFNQERIREMDDLLNELDIEHDFITIPGVGHSHEDLYDEGGDIMLEFFAEVLGPP